MGNRKQPAPPPDGAVKPPPPPAPPPKRYPVPYGMVNQDPPPPAALLYLDELIELAERVAYHFENQQHPIGDAARDVLKKVRGA